MSLIDPLLLEANERFYRAFREGDLVAIQHHSASVRRGQGPSAPSVVH